MGMRGGACGDLLQDLLQKVLNRRHPERTCRRLPRHLACAVGRDHEHMGGAALADLEGVVERSVLSDAADALVCAECVQKLGQRQLALKADCDRGGQSQGGGQGRPGGGSREACRMETKRGA